MSPPRTAFDYERATEDLPLPVVTAVASALTAAQVDAPGSDASRLVHQVLYLTYHATLANLIDGIMPLGPRGDLPPITVSSDGNGTGSPASSVVRFDHMPKVGTRLGPHPYYHPRAYDDAYDYD